MQTLVKDAELILHDESAEGREEVGGGWEEDEGGWQTPQQQ